MRLFKKKPAASELRRPPSRDAARPPAYSYYARRYEQEANTGRKLNRQDLRPAMQRFGRFWLQRFGLGILLLAALICAFEVMRLSTVPEIIPLVSGGSQNFLHDQTAYRQAAQSALNASIWNHNKLTIDTGRISEQLLRQFPELAGVSVTLPLLAHRPVVYIEPAQPALILHAQNGSYVISDTGKALLASDQAKGLSGLHLPVVTDQSGLPVALNHEVLTAADVQFIRTVIIELGSRHQTIGSLTLPPGSRELDVHLQGEPYFVKFNLANSDPRQQAGTFLAVQAKLAAQHITPGQYIDVRVDGRAYYL